MKTKSKEKQAVKGTQKTRGTSVRSDVRVTAEASSSPRRLGARSSFSVFLADFKAASSK